MKKILLIGIIGLSYMFGSVNHLDNDTTLVVLDGNVSQDFNKKVIKMIKQNSSTKVLYKRKLEEAARIEEAQAQMAEKYKLNLIHKNVSKKELEDSHKLQSHRIANGAKYFLDSTYSEYDKDKCASLKSSKIYYKAICEAKEDKIEEAMKDLDSILKVDDRAYCMKSMIRLMKAEDDSNAISDSTKDVILLKMRGFKRTHTCVDVFEIATQKVERIK